MGRIYAKCASDKLVALHVSSILRAAFSPNDRSLAHAVQLFCHVRQAWLCETKTFSRTNRLEHRGGTEPTGRGRGLSAGFAHRDVFLYPNWTSIFFLPSCRSHKPSDGREQPTVASWSL